MSLSFFKPRIKFPCKKHVTVSEAFKSPTENFGDLCPVSPYPVNLGIAIAISTAPETLDGGWSVRFTVSKWGLSNGGLRRLSTICAQSCTIVHFCGLFGPLSEGNFRHKMTTIVGNRGQLWTSTLSPHLESPHLDFPDLRHLSTVPCPSFPFFCGKRHGKPPKKQGFFIPTEPLKSLGKKGKTFEKTRNSSRREKKKKKQGIPKKKQGKEGQGCSRLPTNAVILRRKFPLERGPKGPPKCTIVDDCVQTAESGPGLKAPLESPSRLP